MSFTSEFLIKIDGKIPQEYLPIIEEQLSLHCANYNIERQTYDLITQVNWIPEEYKIYMVSRKIEGLSDITLKNYQRHLEKFFNAVKKPLLMITSSDVRLYLYNYKQNNKIENQSLNKIRQIIDTFFNWCEKEGYIANNPCKNIKPIKCTVKPREPLSTMELEKLRYACKDFREAALLEFLFSTGARVAEASIVKIKDINFDENTVLLFGKGSKYRTSYLTDKAKLMIQLYLETRDDNTPELFVSERNPHEKLSRRSIERIISQLGERAMLDRSVYPHLIRHTTATMALERGMDITEIQRLLGHANISTTLIYAAIDDSKIHADHKKYLQ